MSKAEEKAKQRALEAYPILMCYNDFQMVEEDVNKPLREIYQEGYHQAEKDLELTWEDIREIYCTTLNLREHLGASVFGEPLYQEVLKSFKEWKMK